MQNTQVKELMEDQIVMVSPDDTLAEASKKMKSSNCGFLPVGKANKPEGVITDRDIVIRAIALGKDPAMTKVQDCMTEMVATCKNDDTLMDVASKMREHGVSRLVVLDRDNTMCGVLSFGRILRNHDDQEEVSDVVACVSGRKTAIPSAYRQAGGETRPAH